MQYIPTTQLAESLKSNELASLMHCLWIATDAHRLQIRKDLYKTPYINHPIGVAHFLVSVGQVTELKVLQAALLHDTLEDTKLERKTIRDNFGTEVLAIVEEVTDNKSLPKIDRKMAQIEHAMHMSKEAKLVKLADKLHNLADLSQSVPIGWDQLEIQGYFCWSLKVIEGLRGTNQQLEDALDKVFECEIITTSNKFPVLPPIEERDSVYTKYLDRMKKN